MKFKKTPFNKLTLFAIFLVISSMLLLLVIDSKALASGLYGNAVAADLLSGKTATVDSGAITGTMTNMSSYNSSVSSAVGGGTLYTRIPQGAYLTNTVSGYPEITTGVPDLVSGNILSGKNILGVAGGITNYSGGVHILSQQNTVCDCDGEGYNSVYAQPPAGYYDGASWIRTREANLVAGNIKSGVSILGIAGTYGNGMTNYASGTSRQTTVPFTITGLSFQPTVITAWWYYNFAFWHFTWSTQIVAYQGKNALYTIDNQPGQYMAGTATPNASGFTISYPTTYTAESGETVYWAAFQ